MWWFESRASILQLTRVAVGLATALLVAGCFQPLYGDGSVSGRPALRNALSSVDVLQIDAPSDSSLARLAVQVRNDLLFNFTGGGAGAGSTHRLKVNITGGGRSVIAVDRRSALPNVELTSLNARYVLTEIATGKVVVSGAATTNLSYDSSGGQRFARVTGIHDAERRAAKVISDNITTRLAAYFVSGG